MGWLDYHLHMFKFPKGKKWIEIGLPDEEDQHPILPGWEVGIMEFFTLPGVSALYEYDFGDCWTHEVLLEGISIPAEGVPAVYRRTRRLPARGLRRHEWLRGSPQDPPGAAQ